jgi:hypothetical protein
MKKSMKNENRRIKNGGICRDVVRRVSDKKHGKQQDVCHIPHIFDNCHQERKLFVRELSRLIYCCLIINLLT